MAQPGKRVEDRRRDNLGRKGTIIVQNYDGLVAVAWDESLELMKEGDLDEYYPFANVFVHDSE